MADYPFLDPTARYYGSWARLTDCVKHIGKSSADYIRARNGHWRCKLTSGAAGSGQGYTVSWRIANYPAAPVAKWDTPWDRIQTETTLSAVVELRLYPSAPGSQGPSITLPPSCNINTGEFEEQGSQYSAALYTDVHFFHEDGGEQLLNPKMLPLSTPLSIDGLLIAVGVALEQADDAFAAEMYQKSLTYSDPVSTSPETVTLADTRYQSLLREQADNEGSRAQVEEFRLWCQAYKGVSTVEEGMRACTTAELLDWLTKQSWYIGYYLQLRVGQDLARRVLAYEAVEAIAREAASAPITHISPWGGEDSE